MCRPLNWNVGKLISGQKVTNTVCKAGAKDSGTDQNDSIDAATNSEQPDQNKRKQKIKMLLHSEAPGMWQRSPGIILNMNIIAPQQRGGL